MVDPPIEITYDDLLTAPLIERDITLTCVSNEVGGHLTGNARWLGALLAPLLREAGVRSRRRPICPPRPTAWTIGTPLSAVDRPAATRCSRSG